MWQAVKSLYIPNYDLKGLQLTILIYFNHFIFVSMLFGVMVLNQTKHNLGARIAWVLRKS